MCKFTQNFAKSPISRGQIIAHTVWMLYELPGLGRLEFFQVGRHAVGQVEEVAAQIGLRGKWHHVDRQGRDVGYECGVGVGFEKRARFVASVAEEEHFPFGEPF